MMYTHYVYYIFPIFSNAIFFENKFSKRSRFLNHTLLQSKKGKKQKFYALCENFSDRNVKMSTEIYTYVI